MGASFSTRIPVDPASSRGAITFWREKRHRFPVATVRGDRGIRLGDADAVEWAELTPDEARQIGAALIGAANRVDRENTPGSDLRPLRLVEDDEHGDRADLDRVVTQLHR